VDYPYWPKSKSLINSRATRTSMRDPYRNELARILADIDQQLAKAQAMTRIGAGLRHGV